MSTVNGYAGFCSIFEVKHATQWLRILPPWPQRPSLQFAGLAQQLDLRPVQLKA
jgi:hypothetical protein